jgi:hypothetical protein
MEEKGMNSVQRERGIQRFLRKVVLGQPVQKFVTAGSMNCRQMIQESKARKRCIPGDNEILASAEYDLTREILCGFWDIRAA